MSNRIIRSNVDFGQPLPLSPERREELAALAEQHKDKIDFSDAPFLGEEAWASAEVGRFYRGPKQAPVAVVDADIISWFQAEAEKDHTMTYRERINEVLRREIQSHQGGILIKKTA